MITFPVAMGIVMMVVIVMAHTDADADGTDADANLGIRSGGAQHSQRQNGSY
jgi:hypothetical protein